MNIENLKCFIAVASCESFTKASEQLFLTQSTVSRRVARLEDDLGKRLIVRSNSSDFTLTREGKLVLREGRLILSSVSSLIAQLNNLEEDIHGAVRIGFYGMFPYLDIVAKLQEFLGANYPRVELIVHSNKISQIDNDLEANDSDIFVSLQSELKAREGYACRVLFKRDVVALMPKSHRLAARSRLSIEDLRNEPLVFWEKYVAPGFYDALVEECDNAGFSPHFSELHDHEDNIMLSVHSGHGITVLFDRTAALDDNLVQLPISGTSIPVDVAYCYKRDPDRQAVAAVLDALEFTGLTIDS